MAIDQPEDNAIYELFPDCQFQSPRNFDALRNRQIEKNNAVVTLSSKRLLCQDCSHDQAPGRELRRSIPAFKCPGYTYTELVEKKRWTVKRPND